MVEMRGLFGNLNNTLNNLPLSGNLGLLTTGVSLLEGQPIGQAVRSGLQTYQGLSSIDEERKRKALVQDLVSKGGFTPQEQALILASKNPASVAAQIRGQKAAAANKPPSTAKGADGFLYYTDGELAGQRVLPNVTKAPTQTKIEPLTMISEEEVTIGNRVIPANTPFNVLGTDQESFKSATDQGAYTIAKPQQITQTTLPPMETVKSIENVIEQTEGQVEGEKFDIGTAAGGDVKGVVTDLANAFLGFTVGLPLSEERSRQSAFIANANNQIKVPMVRALAPRGAKYARDEIDKILPQSTDSNPKFVSKLKELLPDIQDTIEVIANDIALAEIKDGEGTAIALRGQLRGLVNYKLSAENALKNFNENDEKSAEEIAADAILELSK